MKRIIIGDIHGKDVWRKIVQNRNPDDVVVFMGDYFDSFNVPSEKQLENFNGIVTYKRMFPENTILLVGNHDFQYLKTIFGERYSGFDPSFVEKFGQALESAMDVLQMCYYGGDDYLFSHAGISTTWCKDNGIDIKDDFVSEINALFKTKPSAFSFNRACSSPYGDDKEQSPIWIRPDALYSDNFFVGTQVVGHTRVETPQIYSNNDKKILLVDTLDRGQYSILEDGLVKIMTV